MPNEPKREPTPEEIDELIYELIQFCVKWGMWADDGPVILSGGNLYMDCVRGEEGSDFHGLKVRIEKAPLEYYVDLPPEFFPGGSNGLGHILSIISCGRLAVLLDYYIFELYFSDLSEKGFDELLRLDPWIMEKALEQYEEYLPILNPLEFKSQDEFLTFENELQDLRYLDEMERVRKHGHFCYKGGPVVKHIRSQFDGIFEKYGLYYQVVPQTNFCLTCFLK